MKASLSTLKKFCFYLFNHLQSFPHSSDQLYIPKMPKIRNFYQQADNGLLNIRKLSLNLKKNARQNFTWFPSPLGLPVRFFRQYLMKTSF